MWAPRTRLPEKTNRVRKGNDADALLLLSDITHLSVTIAASSGLSEAEIEAMIKQAEQNAEKDRERREAIEMANRADSVAGDTEKALNDFKDQLDSGEAEKLRTQLQGLREEAAKAQAGDSSVNPADLKAKIDELQQASLKLFEMVYKQRAADSEDSGSTGGSSSGSNTTEGEYRDVNDDKKN